MTRIPLLITNKPKPRLSTNGRLSPFSLVPLLLLLFCLGLAPRAKATTIVSVTPPDGATGVSASTQVVFTFSAPMYSAASFAFFSNTVTGTIIPTIPSWSANNTVLTCSALSGFPANSTLDWEVYGVDASFQPLTGTTTGSFSTGTGSGSTSIGTNAFTSFDLLRLNNYDQSSSGAPVLNPNYSYSFSAVADLVSNRSATSITLTLPSTTVSNLTEYIANNDYSMVYWTNDLTTIEDKFPAGNYTYFIQAAASNQTVVVAFPSTTSMPQPSAPHVTDYAAAQAIDPTQNFLLTWDAFQNGTASDYISLEIQSTTGGTVFKTADYGKAGALNGTITSFSIPTGTFTAGSTYTATLGFYRAVANTNSTYATFVARASATTFNLAAAGGATVPLVLTNLTALPGGGLTFDVLCSPSQVFTIESTTDLSSGVWQSLLTTNPTVATVHFSDTTSAGQGIRFYRAKNGP